MKNLKILAVTASAVILAACGGGGGGGGDNTPPQHTQCRIEQRNALMATQIPPLLATSNSPTLSAA